MPAEFPDIVDRDDVYFGTSEQWIAAVSEQLPRIWEERDASPWQGPLRGDQPADIVEQFGTVSRKLTKLVDFYRPRLPPGLLNAIGLTDPVLHRMQNRRLPRGHAQFGLQHGDFHPGQVGRRPDGGLVVIDEEDAAPGSSVYDMTTFLLNDNIGGRYPTMNTRILDTRTKTELDWHQAFAPLVASRSVVSWSGYLVRQLRARSFLDPRGERKAPRGGGSWDQDLTDAVKMLNRLFVGSQRHIPSLVTGADKVRDLLDEYLARPRTFVFTTQQISVGAEGSNVPTERSTAQANLRPTVTKRSAPKAELPEFPAAARGFTPVFTRPGPPSATRAAPGPPNGTSRPVDLAAMVTKATETVSALVFKDRIHGLELGP